MNCNCGVCVLIEGTPDVYWCNLHDIDVTQKWEKQNRDYRIGKNQWLLNVLKNVFTSSNKEQWYIEEIKDELRRDNEHINNQETGNDAS